MMSRRKKENHREKDGSYAISNAFDYCVVCVYRMQNERVYLTFNKSWRSTNNTKRAEVSLSIGNSHKSAFICA